MNHLSILLPDLRWPKNLFEEQMQDRCYPEWRLSRAIASLYLPGVSIIVGADKASKEVTTILARSIPSVEIGDSLKNKLLYHI